MWHLQVDGVRQPLHLGTVLSDESLNIIGHRNTLAWVAGYTWNGPGFLIAGLSCLERPPQKLFVASMK